MEHWKMKYLSILNSGPKGVDDYGLAMELISEGYAKGTPITSHGKENYGITGLRNWAVTPKGRLFADDLAQQTWQAILRRRLVQGAISLTSFVAGGLIHKLLGCP